MTAPPARFRSSERDAPGRSSRSSPILNMINAAIFYCVVIHCNGSSSRFDPFKADCKAAVTQGRASVRTDLLCRNPAPANANMPDRPRQTAGRAPLPVIPLRTLGNALSDAFGASVPRRMRQMVHFDISRSAFPVNSPAGMRPWRISGAAHQFPVRRIVEAHCSPRTSAMISAAVIPLPGLGWTSRKRRSSWLQSGATPVNHGWGPGGLSADLAIGERGNGE